MVVMIVLPVLAPSVLTVLALLAVTVALWAVPR
jgi:hypothetical protein